MLVECILTAILVIIPATPGLERYLPARWLYAYPHLSGMCVNMSGHGPRVYIAPSHHLIIDHAFMRYEIPLPPRPGRWPLRYILGADTAYVEPWGNIQVRFGPKEPI